MKIILRKKDSVTSIVLFIFNIYGEYASQYSIQLNNLIDFMQQFGKNETSTRMGLSRMVKAGILINKKIEGEVVYQLTEYGFKNIHNWNHGIAMFFNRYEKRHQVWNKKWSAITLLDFNKSDKERQTVIDDLTEIGLREIIRNTWVCPYQMSDEVDSIAARENVKYLSINDGDISLNFPANEFINDVFQVAWIRKRYREFLDLMRDIEMEFDEIKENAGYCLALLFKLGWNFYDIAISDPALPKELLNDWEGDRVVQEFQQLRTRLYEKVKNYWDRKISL